jgi:hypothetical protein
VDAWVRAHPDSERWLFECHRGEERYRLLMPSYRSPGSRIAV